MALLHATTTHRNRRQLASSARNASAKLAIALAFCTQLLLARAAFAQNAVAPASPFLPPDHWARAAVEQLDAYGLITAGFDPGVRVISRGRVTELFAIAHVNADGRAPEFASLVRAYEQRFREEYDPNTAAGSAFGVRHVGSEALVGYTRAAGIVHAGFGYDNATNWTGPRTQRDTSGALALGTINALLGRYAAISISPRVAGSSIGVSEGYLALERWHLGAWAGRRGTGFGPGPGSGLLWNEHVALTGAGMYLPRPVHFPAFLRAMGWIQLESFIAMAGDTAPYRNPFLWGARGSMTPHPRLTIGFNRAAMFGGSGNAPVTLKNLARTFVGINSAGKSAANKQISFFANQLFSMDVRYRVPVPALFPVIYGEAAMDDGAGMYHNVPGIRLGTYIPGIPGARTLGLGVERTSFAHSCCGNPAWYRNFSFTNGWAEDGRPLGHPLGGNGVEWRLYGRASFVAARVTLALDLFARDRGAENLFAPARAGSSRGAEGQLSVRMIPTADLVVSVSGEDGARGWSSSSLSTGIRAHF